MIDARCTTMNVSGMTTRPPPVSRPRPAIAVTAIAGLGREPGGGLVVMPDTFMVVHRASIIAAAARNNVPAVFWLSDFAREGGLLSYGPDVVDPYRRAASYVDRILR